jgi:SAM-dependent methyltransferase
MRNTIESQLSLYSTDEYISKNPTLHEEDSPWKLSLIYPLIDTIMSNYDKEEINILDIGGGAGIILSEVSSYIIKKYNVKVNKFALDLSPRMLEAQKKNNLDLKLSLIEDIRKTSISDKQIELTLMIDVLEHIPEPTKALAELNRISSHVIFKVPLENCLKYNLLNLITRGKFREKNLIEKYGHINVYNEKQLENQVRASNGVLIKQYYTNVFRYYNDKSISSSLIDKITNVSGEQIYKISPRFSSFLFGDFVMLLVKY